MMAKFVLVEVVKLTTGGWIVMLGCISFVCLLGLFCVTRILKQTTPSEHRRDPLDADAGEGDDR